ncbi:MAG: ferrous iron transporter B [Candidatus Borkfalkiaceae bacterium]|nr:ferrous iron transporter B [Christensenellaceae bacterium]
MKKAFIFGIANSGKTTLFNGLTGRSERTGNWYGVTTEEKSGSFYLKNGEKVAVYDLPGSYFDGYTLEGKVASNVLKNKVKGGAAIVLCEAVSLEKGLKLLKTVGAYTDKIALVINFYGELLRRGGKMNFERLKSEIGCEVIACEVNEKVGVDAVKGLIYRLFKTIDGANAEKTGAENKSKILRLADINEREIAQKTLVLPKAKLSAFDNFLLNKRKFSLIAFSLLFFATAYLSFGEYGIGKALSKIIDVAIKAAISNPAAALLERWGASPFISAFVCDGVIGSVCALITFLPPLLVLQLFICFAEESGILARAAFLFDEFFSFAGLSGRAIFTFLTGYGCTAAAALCAEGLENEKSKKRAILALPFIPCSAKTPVFLYVLSAVGGKFLFLIISFFYVAGLFFAAVFAFINKKIKKEKNSELIVEFPPYRFPKTKTALKSLQKFTKSFIIKIGLTVFTVTMCFWLVGSITPQFAFTKNVNESLLCLIGKKLDFIFAPIGVKDWRFSLAAFAGIFAKEGVASVLIACGGASGNAAWLISYLVFFALYSPCLAALSAIRKSAGIKYSLHAFFCQNVLAVAFCYATYYIITFFAAIFA